MIARKFTKEQQALIRKKLETVTVDSRTYEQALKEDYIKIYDSNDKEAH